MVIHLIYWNTETIFCFLTDKLEHLREGDSNIKYAIVAHKILRS